MNCGSVLDRGRIDLRQNGLKPPDASRKRITITIDRVSHKADHFGVSSGVMT
jgi:hypothetical protein